LQESQPLPPVAPVVNSASAVADAALLELANLSSDALADKVVSSVLDATSGGDSSGGEGSSSGHDPIDLISKRLRGALDTATAAQGQDASGVQDASIPPTRSALLHVLLSRQQQEEQAAAAAAVTKQQQQQSPVRQPTAAGTSVQDAGAVAPALAPVSEETSEQEEELSSSSSGGGKSGATSRRKKRNSVPGTPEAVPTATSADDDNSDPVSKSGKNKRKVSDLIARFEHSASTSDLRTTRSVTPDRAARSLTPEDAQQRPVSAAANLQTARAQSSDSVLERVPEAAEDSEPEKEPLAEAINRNVTGASNNNNSLLVEGACALEISQEDLDIDPELLRQLQEEGVEIDEEGMAKVGMRGGKGGGGYTSYVFISSSSDSGSTSSNNSGKKVVVNVKEPSSNCIVLQDGRASNISIVSTESSDLGSPVDEMYQSMELQQAPDIPAKHRNRDGSVVDMSHRFMDGSEHHMHDYHHRSRGGVEADSRYVLDEDEEEIEEGVDEEDDDLLTGHEESPVSDRTGGAGLATYFTTSLEASSPSSQSRRGRPPVIRAADRAARTRMMQNGGYQYADQQQQGGYDITEVPPNADGQQQMYDDEEYYDPQMHKHYDVRYAVESGESGEGEEYIEDEDDVQAYPMCQPVYDDDDELLSGEEYTDELLSGDEYFDREEELRGYNNRQIDFTLHTILEESNEDSESGRSNKSNSPRAGSSAMSPEEANRRKRLSDPSELEKYFFYGVGNGKQNGEEEVASDTTVGSVTEDNSMMNTGDFDDDDDEYEDDLYYLSGRSNNAAPQVGQTLPEIGATVSSSAPVVDAASVNTDDSGSVGSESDGQQHPMKNRKKVVHRSKRDVSGEEGEPPSYSSGSSDEYATPGGFPSSSDDNTIKRKKNGGKKAGKNVEQVAKAAAVVMNMSSPKMSPPITPLPSQIIEVQPALISKESNSGSEERESLEASSKSSSASAPVKQSPGPSPPPNVIRKHKSRDSGFVGSMDDLLRNENNSNADPDSGNSLSDEAHGTVHQVLRLEKVSEVSENTEDDTAEVGKDVGKVEENKVERKDSFNQWSSDEDTNIMMSRMRSFFRGLLASSSGPQQLQQQPERKPQQLEAFEKELTRLMRTVPGIKEEQVREIVEYLSSEDTWSGDSCTDSSDYTSCGSDLDAATGMVNAIVIPDMDMSMEIREQISKSCREIIDKFNEGKPAMAEPHVPLQHGDFQKETALMYQKLMAKMHQSHPESHPIASKVMQHISSRLVALMHEVRAANTAKAAAAAAASVSLSGQVPFADRRQIGPPTRRYKRTPVTTATKSNASSEGYEDEEQFEGTRRKSVDDKQDVWNKESTAAVAPPHPPPVAQSQRRRGSLGGQVKTATADQSDNSSSNANDDHERHSWKGSFESQLGSKSEQQHHQQQQVKRLSARQPSSSSASSSRRSQQGPSDSESEQIPIQSRRGSATEGAIAKPARTTNNNSNNNSLPRMGTSSIKTRQAATGATLSSIEPQSVSLATSLAAGPMPQGQQQQGMPRSARYRPPGYKKQAPRKPSPSSPGSLRRPSFADRYAGRCLMASLSESGLPFGRISAVFLNCGRQKHIMSVCGFCGY
jgi:hypothetical protein